MVVMVEVMVAGAEVAEVADEVDLCRSFLVIRYKMNLSHFEFRDNRDL